MADSHYDQAFEQLSDDDDFEEWREAELERVSRHWDQAWAEWRRHVRYGKQTRREIVDRRKQDLIECDPIILGDEYREQRARIIEQNDADRGVVATEDEWTKTVDHLLKQAESLEHYLDRKFQSGDLGYASYYRLADHLSGRDYQGSIRSWRPGEGQQTAYEIRAVIRLLRREILGVCPHWQEEVDQFLGSEAWLPMDHTLESPIADCERRGAELLNEDQLEWVAQRALSGKSSEEMWGRMAHELAEEKSAIERFLHENGATEDEKRQVTNAMQRAIGSDRGAAPVFDVASRQSCRQARNALDTAKQTICNLRSQWRSQLASYLESQRTGESTGRGR